ncbi:MAG: M24 family metallopeptidase [Acidobacteriaceae bacterium]
MNHQHRFRQLRATMAKQKIAALLVTHLPDVRYLCGFTGSNAALAITAKQSLLVTDGRYTAQASAEVKGPEVRIAKGPALDEACRWLAETRAKYAYYDGEQTTVAALGAMQEALKGSGKNVKQFFQPLPSPLIAMQRMVKDAGEIERMAAAAALGVRLFENILSFMRPGITENAVAAELEYRARQCGTEAMSFPTIVASGERSAMPHGTASDAKLPRRGFVTLDFGVILNGYCSDMTRTVHLGRATAREREAYDAVLAAQEHGVAAVGAGVKAGDVDEAARSVLREAKLADYFTHSTGHGVGLEIHESPRIAMAQQALLTKGMVITIEPGIYIPGAFGLRIEDTVVVERRGCRVLTPATKAWIEL